MTNQTKYKTPEPEQAQCRLEPLNAPSPADMQKNERWRPLTGNSNPSARLRAARSMPQWLQNRGGIPAPPPPPPVDQDLSPDPDYEVIDFPSQPYSNAPPTTVELRVRRCDLCGSSAPSVQCTQCPQQNFCASCDDMYHRHPKRQAHVRKVLEGGLRRPDLRPPLPPKGEASAAPVPPPRKNKRHPTSSPLATSGLHQGMMMQAQMPKKETGFVGSLKRIITGRSLPPPPARDRSASLIQGHPMDFHRSQMLGGELVGTEWDMMRSQRMGSMTSLNVPLFNPLMQAQSMAQLNCPNCWGGHHGWGSQLALHQPPPGWYPTWDPGRRRARRRDSSSEDEAASPALSRRSSARHRQRNSDSDEDSLRRPHSRPVSRRESLVDGVRHEEDVLRGRYEDDTQSLRGHRRRESESFRTRRRDLEDSVSERGGRRRRFTDDVMSDRGGRRRFEDTVSERGGRRREVDVVSERGGRRDDLVEDRQRRKFLDEDLRGRRDDKYLDKSYTKETKKQDKLPEPVKRSETNSVIRSDDDTLDSVCDTSDEKNKKYKRNERFSDTGQRRRATLEAKRDFLEVSTSKVSESSSKSVTSEDQKDDGKEIEVEEEKPLGPIPTCEWECEHCTFINQPGSRVCDVCCKTTSNPKPKDGSKPTKPEGSGRLVHHMDRLNLKEDQAQLKKKESQKELATDSVKTKTSKGTSPPPQSISTQTYEAAGARREWSAPQRSTSRQSLSDSQSATPPRSRSPETDSHTTDSKGARSQPPRKSSRAGSQPPEYISTLVQKQVKQGLEMVKLLREAEEHQFSADDVAVALEHCADGDPIEWLLDNWRNMIDTVVTLGTNYGHERKENTIGTISAAEARDALRVHQGNVWAAVTECIQQRQRKYAELLSRGNFSREDIVTVLTANHGNLEAAYTELSKGQLKPFLMRIWGPPQDTEPSPQQHGEVGEIEVGGKEADEVSLESEVTNRVESWLTEHVYKSHRSDEQNRRKSEHDIKLSRRKSDIIDPIQQTKQKLKEEQKSSSTRRHSDVHRFLNEVFSANSNSLMIDTRYSSLHNLSPKKEPSGSFNEPPERYTSCLNLNDTHKANFTPLLYHKQTNKKDTPLKVSMNEIEEQTGENESFFLKTPPLEHSDGDKDKYDEGKIYNGRLQLIIQENLTKKNLKSSTNDTKSQVYIKEISPSKAEEVSVQKRDHISSNLTHATKNGTALKKLSKTKGDSDSSSYESASSEDETYEPKTLTNNSTYAANQPESKTKILVTTEPKVQDQFKLKTNKEIMQEVERIEEEIKELLHGASIITKQQNEDLKIPYIDEPEEVRSNSGRQKVKKMSSLKMPGSEDNYSDNRTESRVSTSLASLTSLGQSQSSECSTSESLHSKDSLNSTSYSEDDNDYIEEGDAMQAIDQVVPNAVSSTTSKSSTENNVITSQKAPLEVQTESLNSSSENSINLTTQDFIQGIVNEITQSTESLELFNVEMIKETEAQVLVSEPIVITEKMNKFSSVKENQMKENIDQKTESQTSEQTIKVCHDNLGHQISNGHSTDDTTQPQLFLTEHNQNEIEIHDQSAENIVQENNVLKNSNKTSVEDSVKANPIITVNSQEDENDKSEYTDFSSDECSQMSPYTAVNLRTKHLVDDKRLSPIADLEESSDHDISPIPTDSERDISDRNKGAVITVNQLLDDAKQGEEGGPNRAMTPTTMLREKRDEVLSLIKESLSKEAVLDRLVTTLFGVLQTPGPLATPHLNALTPDSETEIFFEAPESPKIEISCQLEKNLIPSFHTIEGGEGTQTAVLQTATIETKHVELIDLEKGINDKIVLHREARRILAEGLVSSYEEAEVAVQLMEMAISREEAVQVASECHTLTAAIAYLHQECPLCANKCTMKEMVGMLGCDHRCCRECAVNYFNMQVCEASVWDCVCPFCRAPDLHSISQDQAQVYFSHLDILLKGILKEQTHELFQRKLRDWTLAQDPNFKWCTKCSSGFIANQNQKRLMCPDCRSITCALCRRPWEKEHEGKSCDEFNSWVEANDPENLLARHLDENGITCPKCQARFTLARGGCMHMTCSHCKHEFCSGCSKPFLMGDKCTVSDYCVKLGLHSHHPRNCLFYLRDKEPALLEKLLKDHGVDFSREVDEPQRSKCPISLLKETTDGFVDTHCDHQVEYAGLCRIHYVEHLVKLIRVGGLDPVEIMDITEATQELWRRGKPIPERDTTDCLYLSKIKKIVQEEIPLD